MLSVKLNKYKKWLILVTITTLLIIAFASYAYKFNLNHYCAEHDYCSALKTKYRKIRKQHRTKYFNLIPEIPFPIKEYSENSLKQPINAKTIIVSHYTLNNDYIKSVIKNHSAYAKLHGYDYWFRNGIIDGNFLDLNSSGEVKASVYALFWQKLTAIQQAMNLMEGDRVKYDWLMWIDGDAVFTNLEQSIKQLRSSIGLDDTDYFIIARDMSCNEKKICFVKTCLNSGVFLIKNNEQGKNFIKKIMDSFDIYYDHDFPEQIAIEDVIFDAKIISPKLSSGIKKIYNNKCDLIPKFGFKVVDSKVMNSGYNNRKNPFGCWKKGDFIAHFAGNKNRNKLIPKFLNCVESNYISKNLHLCENL